MRSPFSLTTGLAVGLVIGLFARTPQSPTHSANQIMDAAYRDGVFLATMDVEKGRRPHLESGRWSTDMDRGSFIAGYEQAYEEMCQHRKGSFLRATTAEVAGYTDGIADAATDESSSHAFQPEKTKNYLRASNGSSQDNEILANVQQEYREAYLNGYQQRYFLNEDASLWGYYAQ
jgi:hypothetical protein